MRGAFTIRSGLLASAALIILVSMRPTASAQSSIEELRALSIGDLLDVEITSVSKRPEPVGQAPASVYVISNEDIHRSGVTNLPDALRLAPNLQVARVSSNAYAISARGFNSFESSNKLLVLIDGRSIYTPLHGGVFWDQQQVLIEDIERIEVISGPGGTLWGANAVNGVINVITRHSGDTGGGLLSGQFSNEDKRGALRYGGKVNENLTYRVYAQDLERASLERANGSSAGDAWDNEQGGFRLDWNKGQNAITLQGDLFQNAFDPDGRAEGKNILGRWTRQLGGASSLQVQTYYDSVERTSALAFEQAETFDIQAQHSFQVGGSHTIVWGGGYRFTREELDAPTSLFVLQPTEGTVHLANIFAQDTFAIDEDLKLTIGTKVERSSFTGLEYLPSARIGWQTTESTFLWAAASRAVRSPSRIDRNLVAPGLLERASDFRSEKLMAYEVGYRGQPTPNTSLSVTLFYHDYDDLRVLTTSPDTGLLMFGNKMEGYTYGVEAWADYRITPWWRLSAGAMELQKNLKLEPGATTFALPQHTGNDPDYQLSLRSFMDLADDLRLDLSLRLVDDLPNPEVPRYWQFDARIAWDVTPDWELSLTGLNLFDERHPEAGDPASRLEVSRTVLVGARWRF